MSVKVGQKMPRWSEMSIEQRAERLSLEDGRTMRQGTRKKLCCICGDYIYPNNKSKMEAPSWKSRYKQCNGSSWMAHEKCAVPLGESEDEKTTGNAPKESAAVSISPRRSATPSPSEATLVPPMPASTSENDQSLTLQEELNYLRGWKDAMTVAMNLKKGMIPSEEGNK